MVYVPVLYSLFEDAETNLGAWGAARHKAHAAADPA